MKFSINLKNKEVSIDADVEGIVEKSLEQNSNNPIKKTRYQIKQEEKRKNEELKNKQQMKYLYILIGICGIFTVIGIVASFFGV